MTIVTVTPEIVEACKEFAEKCAKTNLSEYKKRNQSNLKKITEDIVIGKIGEWAVYQHLGPNFCSPPDMEIYGANKKSFACDLEFKGKKIHVKSQGMLSAKRYGKSWLFQKRDPLFRKPTEDDIVFCCLVDGQNVEILMNKISTDINFGEPKLPQLRHSKVAIYLEDNE